MPEVKIKYDSDNWIESVLMVWGRKEQQRIAMQLKKISECTWDYLKKPSTSEMCVMPWNANDVEIIFYFQNYFSPSFITNNWKLLLHITLTAFLCPEVRVGYCGITHGP